MTLLLARETYEDHGYFNSLSLGALKSDTSSHDIDDFDILKLSVC